MIHSYSGHNMQLKNIHNNVYCSTMEMWTLGVIHEINEFIQQLKMMIVKTVPLLCSLDYIESIALVLEKFIRSFHIVFWYKHLVYQLHLCLIEKGKWQRELILDYTIKL